MSNRSFATVTMAEIAKLQRKEPTKAEQAIWSVLRPLRNSGFTFRRQVPIDRFVLDFYCPTIKLAVEIDGSIHTTEKAVDADRLRQLHLETHHSITFLRFSNAEALRSPMSVRNEILSKINKMQYPAD